MNIQGDSWTGNAVCGLGAQPIYVLGQNQVHNLQDPVQNDKNY